VEPLHAVRPSAMVYDVRQMRMKGEGQKSCGPGRCVWRCLRQGEVPQNGFLVVGAT
jgi:hypothetical protein